MTSILGPEHLRCIGREAAPVRELVTRRDIRKYAIASGCRLAKHLAGDEAPPLFFMALFWELAALDALRADGLAPDPLLPPLPLGRAMAGGVEVQYHAPIRPGEILEARRIIEELYEKEGARGPIVFVVYRTRVATAQGAPRVTARNTLMLR